MPISLARMAIPEDCRKLFGSNEGEIKRMDDIFRLNITLPVEDPIRLLLQATVFELGIMSSRGYLRTCQHIDLFRELPANLNAMLK